jgi:thiamine kinase-like enzyme
MHTAADTLPLDQVLTSSTAWSAQPVDKVQPLQGGRSQSVFLLQHANEFYVLKLKTATTAALNLNVRHEASAQRNAAAADLAPALVYVDPALRYTVSRYINGQTWTEARPGADRVRAVADLLKAIHTLRPGPAQLNLQQSCEQYFTQLLLNQVAQNAILVAAELRLLMREIFDRLEQDPRRCFCHNDLVASNILLSNDGRVRALDWEYAATCSPYFDLATVVNELEFASNERQQLLRHYGVSDERLLEDYCNVQRYITLLWELLTASANEARIIADMKGMLRKLSSK